LTVARRPRVLMVTGAYAPETSGASLQCRRLIGALRDRADFAVLTTSTDPSLPRQSTVEDTPVRRITVDPASSRSKAIAIARMTSSFLELAGGIDIVHLHGFSQKSVLIVTLARALDKRIAIKLTSFGHDDPRSMQQANRAMWWAYAQADRFIGVTPRFGDGFGDTGLDRSRFVFIPNGVDLARFRPASAAERAELRHQLGIATADPMVLFVGFFSRDKNPDVVFEAWASLNERGLRSTLVLVGATTGPYYEIDPTLASEIRARASARNLDDRLMFVDHTDRIEWFHRAADVFVLPTAREGMPNAMLEAMACGVPPVITRLEGVTDWIVTPGVTGELVNAVDAVAFARALEPLLMSAERRQTLGDAARAHVEANFNLAGTADRTFAVYQDLLGAARAS
jgi:glycosyltransferase involved in cell wall biosynthesis